MKMTRYPTNAAEVEIMTEPTFVLGTRQSQLALWQANFIGRLLEQHHPGFQYRLEKVITTGDRKLDQPLPEIGGKGLFTQELETALRAGEIDFVVHSLKDLPVQDLPDLVIAAMPVRENPHDVLISAHNWTLESLPTGARVGTSSLRRGAQLLHARPDLLLLPLRGNVDTRIRKALAGEYDAIILAAAGVYRLGLQAHVRQELPLESMLPAPGQGALAVQCRADDERMRLLLRAIDDAHTRQAVSAERAFLQGMGGGCSAPIAAFGHVQEGQLFLTGLVASVDGQHAIRVAGSAGPDEALALGQQLARQALEQGARDLLPAEKAA
jgi:hydroxymethylbilane synthase